jgi:hypothetical protein
MITSLVLGKKGSRQTAYTARRRQERGGTRHLRLYPFSTIFFKKENQV